MDKKKEVKTAVALKYDTDSGEAPYVVAAGKGALADKIIAESVKNDIPQYEDEKLASYLSRLEIGENIPPELYEVVAQVLLFVDKMDRLKSTVAEKRR
ncbi:MAG: EscU/YscU/HrcU family type III secretion system export apparatus switch protein [Catonella sp.]